jgi:hypothetical protein
MGGGGANTWIEKTSRNSDDRAYDTDRVRERLAKIVIGGKEYDPFHEGLAEILEAAALTHEPGSENEAERPSRKLSRSFLVRTEDREISVPMFRPELPNMPDFKTALAKDFEVFALKAEAAADEERRRILIMLASADYF